MKSQDGIVRVGGVGTGRIFQWAHLNPYPRLMAKARLVGFQDVSRPAAEAARAKYRGVLEAFAAEHPEHAEAAAANIEELRVHDSLAGLLAGVDAIDVCTHPRGRAPVALAALDAGVHVMVEKPMARTWIEADRIARAFAQRPDVFFQLNDDNIHEPKYRKLRELIGGGAVGKLQAMTLIRASGLESTSVLKSQADGLASGGGCLMDYGSHGLAGAWYALGAHLRPVKVEAVGIGVLHRQRVLEGDEFVMAVDDNARIKVLLEDPATGSWCTIFLEASWCGGHIGRGDYKKGGQAGGYVEVVGSEGVIDASSSEQVRVIRCDGEESVTPLEVHPGETVTFNTEIEGFVDAVRTARPPEFDAAFGAEIIAIVGAAYLSALRGRAVTLEELKDYGRSFVKAHGDTDAAAEAMLGELLAPYKPETSS